MNQDLINAVAERLRAGADRESIKQELLAAGYTDTDVDLAYQAAQTVSQPDVNAGGAVILPTVGSLFTDSFRFIFSRQDFLLAALVVGAVIGVADMLLEEPALFGFSEPFAAGLLVSLLVLVLSVVHFAIVVYVTAHNTKQEGGLTYLQGFSWAKENIMSIIWIGILIMLIVITGFVLFIIPGIIFTVYLGLSYFVFAKTGTRGLSALLLSRHAVRGHGLGVWWRQFCVGVVLALLIGIAGLGITAVFSFADTVWSLGLLHVSISILSVLAGMVSLRALSLIYHALEPKIANSDAALAAAPRNAYTIFAWMGIVAIPLAIVVYTFVLFSIFAAAFSV